MSNRWVRLLWLFAALLIPATAPGEVVKLKDESTVRGRLVQVRGDTLVFHTTFGTLRFHREQVVSIVFDDSAAATLLAPAVPGPVAGRAPSGNARIDVVFKDRKLSSKIAIENKKDWDERIAANHIVVEFLIDGHVVYTTVDTTMDKRIYKGHTTIMKNDIELADFGVEAPVGLHQARLIIRNAGSVTHRTYFDSGPLDKELAVDNVDLKPGEIYRVHVEISKGRLKIAQ